MYKQQSDKSNSKKKKQDDDFGIFNFNREVENSVIGNSPE